MTGTICGQRTGFRVAIELGVLTITLNRPDLGNALASAAIPELGETFAAAAVDPGVRTILFNAEGPIFCAGGDVKAFADTLASSPAARHDDFYARMDRARVQMEAFIALPKPIVVACQGAVAGAAVAYPLGADFAIGEPGTRFVFPHQRLGLPPDGGLSYLLPRVVGTRKAVELVLTAGAVEADEAVRLGILSQVVEAGSLQAEARRIAERLARAPRGAVRQAKALLRSSLSSTPGEQLEAERDAIAEAVSKPDFEEGVRAFLEKRRPSWSSAMLEG